MVTGEGTDRFLLPTSALLIASGFGALFLVDALARNFWSVAGPALIIAGYAALGGSIFAGKD